MSDQSPELSGARAKNQNPQLGGVHAITHLLEALNNDDVKTKLRAIESLTKLGNEQVLDILTNVIRSEENIAVQHTAIEALGILGDIRAVPFLLEVANNHPTWVIEALGLLADPRSLDCFLRYKGHNHGWANLPTWALCRLGPKVDDPRLIDRLIELVSQNGTEPERLWPERERWLSEVRDRLDSEDTRLRPLMQPSFYF